MRKALILGACALAAGLAACGGSDDPTSTPVSSQDALQTRSEEHTSELQSH